jgi:hypothetical protein
MSGWERWTRQQRQSRCEANRVRRGVDAFDRGVFIRASFGRAHVFNIDQAV